MKFLKYLIISIILIIFIHATNTFASEEIVFQDIFKVSEDLQQCLIIKEESVELNNKIEILGTYFDNSEALLKNCNDTLEITNKKMINTLDYSKNQEESISKLFKLVKEQKEICDLELKAANPSFFEKLKNNLSYFGFGVIFGVLIPLL